MLTSILANSIDHCHEPIQNDPVLCELEADFEALLTRLPPETALPMQAILDQYKTRITKIAYLQGMKDFFDLIFTLSDEANAILASGHEKGH